MIGEGVRLGPAPVSAAGETPEGRAVHCVYLIADIVGSSRICNRLVETGGRRGADRLFNLINASFGPYLAAIEAADGHLIDMVGDSLHAIWFPARGEALATLGARIGARFAGLLAEQQQAPADPAIPVQARVGLATGVIVTGGQRRAPSSAVIAGPVIERALIALGQAAPGQVVAAEPEPEPVLPIAATPAGAKAAIGSRLGIISPIEDLLDPDGETRALTVLSVELARPEEVFRLPVGEMEARLSAAEQAMQAYPVALENAHLDEKGLSLKIIFGLGDVADGQGPSDVLSAQGVLISALGRVGIRARTGIATGRVFLGPYRIGSGLRTLCFGMPLVVSTRLMEAAGERPLVDAETARIAKRFRWPLRDAPERALSGSQGEVDVAELGQAEGMERAPEPARALIGREAEFDRIRAVFDATDPRRGLVIRGRPGSGKSELMRHARADAAAAGLRVIHIAPRTFAAGRPLAALREILEGELGREAGDLVPADLPEPVLAGRLGEVAAALAELWKRAPPVLVIDDCHWLDEASARLCIRLWRALQGLRLVASLDSFAKQRTAPWIRRLMLAPQDVLDLGGLDITDTRALLRQRLGVGEIDEGALRRIHELSDGLPEAIIEIGRSAGAALSRFEGRSSDRAMTAKPEEVDLPLSVADAVERLIGQFSPADRRVLKIASAAGRRISGPILARAGAGEAEQVARSLKAAETAGIFESHRRRGDAVEYRFVSGMVRNVTYGMMAEASARAAHGALATAIEADRSRTRAERAPELAYHWARSDNRTRAMQALSQAALSAYRRADFATALPWLEQALRLADQAGDTEGARQASDFRRAMWCCWAADCHVMLGNLERGAELCRRGLGYLGERARDGTLPWALFGVGSAVRIATDTLSGSRPTRDARSFASRSRLWLKGQLYAHLCKCLYYHSNEIGMIACALMASDCQERSGRRERLAMPDAVLAYAFGVAGVGGLARWFDRRTQQAGSAHDAREGVQYSLGTRALIDLSVGRMPQAEETARRALAFALMRRDQDSAALARTILALILHHRGRFADAATEFEQLDRQARLEGNDQHLTWGLYARASALLPLGRAEEARRQLTIVEPLVELVDDDLSKLNFAAIAAMAAFEDGDSEEAGHWVDRAERLGQGASLNNWGSFEGFFTATDVMFALALGLPAGSRERAALIDRAKAALAIAARFAGRYRYALPRLEQHRGLVALFDGQTKRARRHLRRAERKAAQFDMPYERARAAALLAHAGRTEAERAEAAALTDALLTELGTRLVGCARPDRLRCL